MDNKKYEQLINLVINENEEQARELFHEIVVEKSREIFESIMAEEMGEEDMDEGMGGQVGDLLDEINAEESGMTEDEDEVADIEIDDEGMGGEDVTDVEMGDEGSEGGAEVEDAVIRIEDKLDQLMAEFEEIMGGKGEGEEEAGEEEMEAGEEEEEEVTEAKEEDEEEDEMDESVMEAVQLQKVSVTHGDDGAQKKSPVAANSGKAGMDSKPVKFSGEGAEKGRTAPGTKDLPGAGKFKNAPGHKGQDLEKTPAPVKKDAASGTKSPVAK